MPKIDQYLFSLAGEYRICSELNKRGVFATVTYGNRKSVDVFAIGSDHHFRALKVEVKTIQERKFVTRIAQRGSARAYLKSHPDFLKREGPRGLPRVYEQALKDPDAPDFWVLFQIRPNGNGEFAEKFFILTHKEACRAQEESSRNSFEQNKFRWNLLNGVDNVTAEKVQGYEDKWSKIVSRFSGGRSKGNNR